MDLNLYKLFAALYAQQNITRAASQVGMTQPAASNALQRLRQQLGDPLFIRTRTGMMPTDYARQIAPDIDAALLSLTEIKAVKTPPGASITGLTKRVRLVMSDLEEQLLLGRITDALAEQNSALPLEIIPQHRVNLETGFRDNLFDFAFLFMEEPIRNIQSLDLFDLQFVCITAKNHPSLEMGMPLETYLNLNHLLVAPGKGGMKGWVDKELQKVGKKRRVTLSVPHFAIAGELVSRTSLVATLPDKLAHKLAEIYPLSIHKPPLPLPGFRLGIHWHSSRDRDPEHTAFRKWAYNLLSETPEP